MSAPPGDALLRLLSGELEPNERAELERRLAEGDVEAAEALAEARDTLASLALDLDPVAPPDAVRERLLGRVRAAAAGGPSALVGSGDIARRRSAPRRPPRLWTALVGSAVAAGVVVLAGTFVTERYLIAPLVAERDELRVAENRAAAERARLEAERAELEAEIEELEERAETLIAETRAAEQVVALLREPDLIAATLAPGELQPEATGRIFWDREDYRCYLHVQKLEPPGDERTLVLWVVTDDGRAIAAGTLEPDFAGEATLLVELPRDVEGIARALVSAEAEVGDAPAGPALLSWTAPPAGTAPAG